MNTYTNYTSSDYNGFRPNPGAVTSFQWNSPPFRCRPIFRGLRRGAGGGFTWAVRRRPRAALAHRRLPVRAAGACRLGVAAAGRGRLGAGTAPVSTLAAYSQATNQDRHSVLVDYDIFVNVPKLDAQDPNGAASLQGGGFRFPTKT